MSPALAVKISEMTKRYKGHVAVDRMTLEVPVGSVFGLLGENGAGKTTTIQSLLGLILPDEGRVETLGLEPGHFGLEVRRRVGYVPERPTLYEWMTVTEIGWF
ncbi:ATP-binding cassette domain-containing protein, partial [Singulisphaera rosea]